MAAVGDEDVGGADIAVNDAEGFAGGDIGSFMGELKAFKHLHDDEESDIDGDANVEVDATAEDIEEVFAFDVLHDYVVSAIVLAEVEDLNDIGMIEGDGEFRLIDEHFDELFIFEEVSPDEFNGEFFFETGGAEHFSAKELGHAAGPEPIDD